jgi:hypothetical protein
VLGWQVDLRKALEFEVPHTVWNILQQRLHWKDGLGPTSGNIAESGAYAENQTIDQHLLGNSKGPTHDRRK